MSEPKEGKTQPLPARHHAGASRGRGALAAALAGALLLPPSEAWPLVGRSIKKEAGRILNAERFEEMTDLLIVSGSTEYPQVQKKILDEVESTWRSFRCWDITPHKRVAGVYSFGDLHPSGFGLSSALTKIPDRHSGLGILVFSVNSWVGTFHRKTSAKKEVASQVLKVGLGPLSVGYTPGPGEYERRASAKLFEARSGRPVWEASLTYTAGRLGRPKGYPDDIAREDVKERMQFGKFFGDALRRPKNGASCSPARLRRARRALKKEKEDLTKKWIAQLRDDDPRSRAAAAKALSTLGGRKGVPYLLPALRDPDMRVRAIAADSLGKLGDSKAVDPLAEALGDDKAIVRAVAARALGSIGSRRAQRPLSQLLGREKDARVRKAAEKALKDIEKARSGMRIDVDNLLEDMGREMFDKP